VGSFVVVRKFSIPFGFLVAFFHRFLLELCPFDCWINFVIISVSELVLVREGVRIVATLKDGPQVVEAALVRKAQTNGTNQDKGGKDAENHAERVEQFLPSLLAYC